MKKIDVVQSSEILRFISVTWIATLGLACGSSSDAGAPAGGEGEPDAAVSVDGSCDGCALSNNSDAAEAGTPGTADAGAGDAGLDAAVDAGPCGTMPAGAALTPAQPAFDATLGPWPTAYSDSQKQDQRTAGTAMQSAFDAALQKTPTSYTIAPGVYRLQKPLYITNQKNLTIDAAGVELIMEGNDNVARVLSNTNLTIQGPLIVDAEPFSFTQGTIVATDANAHTIDVHLMPNYPPPVAGHRVEFFDTTGVMQPHTQDGVQQVTSLGNDVYRLLMNGFTFTSEPSTSATTIKVGNYVSIEQDGRGAFELRSNTGVHFVDVSMYQGALVWALPELGDDVFEQFHGIRRPGTNRLTGGGWFLMSFTGGSFTLKDSEVSHNFDDLTDINVPSDFSFAPVDTTHVHVLAVCAAVGKTLDFYDYVTYRKVATAKVVAMQETNTTALSNQWTTLAAKYNVRPLGTPNLATLDAEVPSNEFYYVDCVDDHMKSATFINNYLHDGLAGGIQPKGADRVVVQNNIVERTNLSGIGVGFDPYWWEGTPSSNVSVTNNTVRHCPYLTAIGKPTIFIYAGGSYDGLPPQAGVGAVMQNITLQGNAAYDAPGAGIGVANADGVTVTCNLTNGVDGNDRGRGSISLDAVAGGAKVLDNVVDTPSPGSTVAPIWSGPRSGATTPMLCGNSTENPTASVADSAWQNVYESDAAIAYTGNGWSRGRQWPDEVNSSSSAQDAAALTFTGMRFRVVGVRNSSSGMAAVYVDGKQVGTFDGSAATDSIGPLYVSDPLPSGSHVARVVVLGQNGHTGHGANVAINGFDVLQSTASVSCGP